jgi:DNA-binding CsgD family transcriptional regulator
VLQISTSGADWPLVGRGEELGLLRRLRSTSVGVSALIAGAAGAGKSRLARAALVEAAGEGWATLAIRGSPGLAGMPLGPFRTVLRATGSGGLDELTDSVAGELTAMRTARGLVVLADDCQDLDEASAGLLQQLVVAGLIVAVMTTRSGTAPPVALMALWTEGLAERIELQNLSKREALELLTAGLGGPVEESSADRIWHVTAGNPLYLREVVLSSTETGALSEVDGQWRWRGTWARGARLQEIVAGRLGRLDPDELTAMEMLAVARSLPLGLVTALTTARAVAGLEARALVTTESSGRRAEVTIAHPVHAEVLRGTMPALRQRSIRRNLVDALTGTGARRTADRVRLAWWSWESGIDVDVDTLSRGADAFLFGIGSAISTRLGEILPQAAGSAMAASPNVSDDPELGVRLAEVAYDRTGAVAEGTVLARTLVWTGDTGRAEALLADLTGKANSVDDRLRLAMASAFVGFWGRQQIDASGGLIDALEAAGPGASPALIANANELLATTAWYTARPATALDYVRRAAEAQGLEVSQSVAAAVAAGALGDLGRCGEAIAVVDRALPGTAGRAHPVRVAMLLGARTIAMMRLGELEQVRELAEWLREVALSDWLLSAAANYEVLLGMVLLRQGRPASAGRIFQDAAGLLAERDFWGNRPWALAGLARARAQAGEEESAAAALEEARRTQTISRNFDMTVYLAEIDLHRLAGRPDAAIRTAERAVDWARRAGIVDDEAQAVDAWLRIAPAPSLAQRLAELATMTDSQLVGVLADHAQALVAADPQSLLEIGERFAAMTAWRMAADAATTAARLFERRHQSRDAQAAVRAAARFEAQCEDIRPPVTAGPAGPGKLTKREREIASLAAAGRSSKEIADRMYLSRRTVENHLYRVYVKLGVTDRTALAQALAPAD